MAYSKARRLSDSISATGEIAAFVDGSITHADLHTDMNLTSKTVLVANASTGDSDTTAANTAFVQQEIAALVDSAPGTLNTLNELAAALGDDASFSTTITNSIALKAPLASPAFNSGAANVVASFTSTDGTGAIQLADNAGNVELAAVGNDFHIQNAGSAAKMVVLNSGNVGIGETGPAYRLHVDGTNVSSGGGLANLCLVDRTAYNGTLPGAGLTFRGEYTSGGNTTNFATIQGIKENTSSGNYDTALRFTTRANGGNLTEKMRINSSGNVGIGVTSPGARLELDNPSSFTNMIEYGNVTWNQNSGHGLVAVNRGSDGYVQLQLTSGVDDSDVFTIRNSGTGANVQHNLLSNGNVYHAGNVGIGTATPGSNHAKANNLVVGSGSAGGMAIFNGTGEGWYAFSRANANNTDAYDGGISYDGSRNLKFHTNAGAARWVISGAGHFTPNNQHSFDIGGTNAEVRDIKAQSIDMGTGTGSARLPNGTTAQRPSSPSAGMMRYNSTTSEFEVYSTMWLPMKTTAPLEFQQPSTQHIKFTIAAGGQSAQAGGGYSAVTVNLNFEGNFTVISKWSHDYMGIGIGYKAGITNGNFTGESNDGTGPYGGGASVDGFDSTVSYMGQYHWPVSNGGGDDHQTTWYIKHQRAGNTISTHYSTNAASATNPSHSSWSQVQSATISSTDHCKPLWGEASTNESVALTLLYSEITGGFNDS